jgi:hypothetical protein
LYAGNNLTEASVSVLITSLLPENRKAAGEEYDSGTSRQVIVMQVSAEKVMHLCKASAISCSRKQRQNNESVQGFPLKNTVYLLTKRGCATTF